MSGLLSTKAETVFGSINAKSIAQVSVLVVVIESTVSGSTGMTAAINEPSPVHFQFVQCALAVLNSQLVRARLNLPSLFEAVMFTAGILFNRI